MSKKILIRDGNFLWKPFIRVDGKTDAGDPYCKDCRVPLEVNEQDIDVGPYVVNGARCPKCGENFDVGKTSVHYPFATIRKNFLRKLAKKELALEDYEIVSLNELPEKARHATIK